MELKDKFIETYPNAFYLELQQTPALTDFLRKQRWMGKNETIKHIEKPGEGNMNFVMRIVTTQKSLIVKQARPWVQKYPQVAAPIERITVEATFYKAIQRDTILKTFTPQLIGYDKINFTLALEDLGAGLDFSDLYQKDIFLNENELMDLMTFISRLHNLPKPPFPRNISMKTLNHEHIFNYPFIENNGFDLDAVHNGLQAVSMVYKKNTSLKKRVQKLGKLYLKNTGVCLIHGDYYPGSWLKMGSGVKVIDPEFGFVGRPEFDLGVLIAHLAMSEHSSNFIEKAISLYEKPSGFDEPMMWSFAGTEILRRILGLAQLPLSLNINQKVQLMEQAVSWIG